MPSFRDTVVFLAGAMAFHTVSHLFIAFAVNLPLETRYMTLTSTMNAWTIVGSGAITLFLLWLANKLAK